MFSSRSMSILQHLLATYCCDNQQRYTCLQPPVQALSLHLQSVQSSWQDQSTIITQRPPLSPITVYVYCIHHNIRLSVHHRVYGFSSVLGCHAVLALFAGEAGSLSCCACFAFEL